MRMSERTSYPNGVPSWVDVSSPDIEASAAFYGGLFGWQYAPAGTVEETGGYGMFTLRDKLVAGIGPVMNPEQPPVWSTYVAVDDADATVAKATDAGGQVAMPATDVMDAGRMAVLIDPTGAFVSLWQAGRTTGAQLVNEPGTFGWSELLCRDAAAATAFYATVFGWEPDSMEMDGWGTYTVFNLGGGGIGGMAEMGEQFPATVPPHWMTYFVVADADESAAKAQELGGTVAQPAFDATGVGRIAILNDSNGTTFAIIALPEGAPG